MRRLYLLMLLIAAVTGAGCAADDFVLTADECYDDEYFDAADEMCYLTCEQDNSCGDNPSFLNWLDQLFPAEVAFNEGEPTPFISYAVAGDEISDAQLGEVDSAEIEAFQADRARHAAMWRDFTTLIPLDARQAISRYSVFTDGEEETMAYVEPNPDDPTTWIIVMDIVDADNEKEQTYTLIHEFGHVLTLNDNEVPFDEAAYSAEDDATVEKAESACPTFFTGEGCSIQQSYINLFFSNFWTDIHAEMLSLDPDDPDALVEFYEQYSDQFVTEYAATNPGEDIAESWTHFVMKPEPSGNSIAEQKVRFFYDFPELIELRSQILARLYSQSRDR